MPNSETSKRLNILIRDYQEIFTEAFIFFMFYGQTNKIDYPFCSRKMHFHSI